MKKGGRVHIGGGDLPSEALFSEAVIELHGEREMTINGFVQLLGYASDQVALLLLGDRKICVRGSALCIECIAKDVLRLCGQITDFSFAETLYMQQQEEEQV